MIPKHILNEIKKHNYECGVPAKEYATSLGRIDFSTVAIEIFYKCTKCGFKTCSYQTTRYSIKPPISNSGRKEKVLLSYLNYEQIR